MALELENLAKTVDTLRRSIHASGTQLASLDPDMRETVKAGVIQHFEVAYEQCWKMIQRWIRENGTPEDADNPRTRKDLFRLAARHGLIADPLPWFAFGDARNSTSHTYDAEKAEAVYCTALEFLPAAEFLLKNLQAAND